MDGSDFTSRGRVRINISTKSDDLQKTPPGIENDTLKKLWNFSYIKNKLLNRFVSIQGQVLDIST